MGSLLNRVLGAAADVKGRLQEHPRVRRAVYDVKNRRLFSQLSPHDQMLADDVRVDTYHAAIAKLVDPGDVVVDIGAGTGILSFYAAKAGARKVYALDHSSLVDTAERMVAASGADTVEFVRTHSREFQPPERANKIIHEQMGYQLFEERMVPNLIDARERLLEPGGRILPARFEFFADPVQLRDDYRLPFVWERNLHGMDLSALKKFAKDQKRQYFLPRMQAAHFSHFLCDPEPLLDVDLETMASPALPGRLSYEREITREGSLDGFAVWFAARFDDELVLSTSPAERNTHWGFTLLRVEAETLAAAGRLSFELRGDLEDALTWDWSHRVVTS